MRSTIARATPPRAAAFAPAAAALLLLASCATVPRIAAPADPLGVLAPGLDAYARISGKAAAELAPAALPAAEAASLRPLLDRTEAVVLGFAPAAADGSRAFEAALVGNYPVARARLALAANKAWKREGAAFRNEAAGLRAAVAGPRLVLASSGPVEPLLARAAAPGPSPLPARLEARAAGELVLWIPDPLRLFAGGFLDSGRGSPALPLRGLLVVASPEGADYRVDAAFLMEDARQARIFRPAVRLAWYFLAASLLGEWAGESRDAEFALEGELIAAEGIALPRAALFAAVATATQREAKDASASASAGLAGSVGSE